MAISHGMTTQRDIRFMRNTLVDGEGTPDADSMMSVRQLHALLRPLARLVTILPKKLGTLYVVDVGPELATQLLANHFLREKGLVDGNRRVRKANRHKLTELMETDKFVTNYDPMMFDTDGYGVNGQHRLQAIEDSGKMYTVLLIVGTAKEAWDGLDQPALRNVGDVLQLSTQSSAIATCGLHILGEVPIKRGGYAHEIESFMSRYQAGYDFVSEVFSGRARKAGLLAPFAMAFQAHPESRLLIRLLAVSTNAVLNLIGQHSAPNAQTGKFAGVLAAAVANTKASGLTSRLALARAVAAGIENYCGGKDRTLLRVGVSNGSKWISIAPE